MGMDDDPMICYASQNNKNNEIIDEGTVEMLGDPESSEYENVGQEFRTVFDVLFFDNSILLIA